LSASSRRRPNIILRETGGKCARASLRSSNGVGEEEEEGEAEEAEEEEEEEEAEALRTSPRVRGALCRIIHFRPEVETSTAASRGQLNSREGEGEEKETDRGGGLPPGATGENGGRGAFAASVNSSKTRCATTAVRSGPNQAAGQAQTQASSSPAGPGRTEEGKKFFFGFVERVESVSVVVQRERRDIDLLPLVFPLFHASLPHRIETGGRP
jgi:hypothetical protein